MHNTAASGFPKRAARKRLHRPYYHRVPKWGGTKTGCIIPAMVFSSTLALTTQKKKTLALTLEKKNLYSF